MGQYFYSSGTILQTCNGYLISLKGQTDQILFFFVWIKIYHQGILVRRYNFEIYHINEEIGRNATFRILVLCFFEDFKIYS